jgi:hypothetical protein
VAYVGVGLAASFGVLLAALENPRAFRPQSLTRASALLIAVAVALVIAGAVSAVVDRLAG